MKITDKIIETIGTEVFSHVYEAEDNHWLMWNFSYFEAKTKVTKIVINILTASCTRGDKLLIIHVIFRSLFFSLSMTWYISLTLFCVSSVSAALWINLFLILHFSVRPIFVHTDLLLGQFILLEAFNKYSSELCFLTALIPLWLHRFRMVPLCFPLIVIDCLLFLI